MKQSWLSRLFGAEEPQDDGLRREAETLRASMEELREQRDRLAAELEEARQEAGQLRRDSEGARSASENEREAQALRQEAESLRSENQKLEKRAATLHEEALRVSAELLEARQKDSRALDEMLAEVDRDRAQLRKSEEEREASRGRLAADLEEARQDNQRLREEAARLHSHATHLESELQHVGGERTRLLSEYGQLRMEAAGFREAINESERLKKEVERLQQELDGNGAARVSAAPAQRGRKGDKSADLTRRDDEIRRLSERAVSLEKELAARGSLLPVAELPAPLQVMLSHLGDTADAMRMVAELWERLMAQESRYNAAREESNRRANENEFLRNQLGDLYSSLVTPITVLSANTDLLLMQRGLPPALVTSLQEMKQTMTAIRQLVGRMQKMTQKLSAGT